MTEDLTTVVQIKEKIRNELESSRIDSEEYRCKGRSLPEYLDPYLIDCLIRKAELSMEISKAVPRRLLFFPFTTKLFRYGLAALHQWWFAEYRTANQHMALALRQLIHLQGVLSYRTCSSDCVQYLSEISRVSENSRGK